MKIYHARGNYTLSQVDSKTAFHIINYLSPLSILIGSKWFHVYSEISGVGWHTDGASNQYFFHMKSLIAKICTFVIKWFIYTCLKNRILKFYSLMLLAWLLILNYLPLYFSIVFISFNINTASWIKRNKSSFLSECIVVHYYFLLGKKHTFLCTTLFLSSPAEWGYLFIDF